MQRGVKSMFTGLPHDRKLRLWWDLVTVRVDLPRSHGKIKVGGADGLAFRGGVHMENLFGESETQL